MARSPYFRNPAYTDFKESVRVASTASVNINLPGASMDGVTLTFGDTVLLKDQGAPETNGIYTWRAPNLPMQRASGGIDHQISSGMLVPVEEGMVNADKIFMLTTDEPIETGVTALVFEEFAPAGAPPVDLLPLNNVWTGTNTFQGSVSVVDSYLALTVTGATSNPFSVNGAGTISWGSGVSPADTNLYRDGASVLKTDDKFIAGSFEGVSGGTLYLYGTGALAQIRSDIADSALYINSTGDADFRMRVLGGGKLEWGDGTAGADVSIERTAPNVLKMTGSNFYVGNDLYLYGPSASINMNNATSHLEISELSGVLPWARIKRNSDSTYRMLLESDGKIQWGDGALAPDISLYRTGVPGLATLNTDGRFESSGDFIAQTGSGYGFIRQNANPAFDAYLTWVDGESDPRHRILIDGTTSWGDGSNPPDTNLYRSSASVLKTDGIFHAANGLELPAGESLTIGGDVTFGRNSSGLALIGTHLRVSGDIEFASNGKLDKQQGSDASSKFLSSRLAINSDESFIVWNDGTILWGGGSAYPDTNLYRSSANTLSTDDAFTAGSNVYGAYGTSSQVRIGDNSGSPSVTFSGGSRIQEISGQIRLDTDTRVTAANFIADNNVSLGSAPADLVGFYGAAPVAQQATPVTLGDVITALQNLGLVA